MKDRTNPPAGLFEKPYRLSFDLKGRLYNLRIFNNRESHVILPHFHPELELIIPYNVGGNLVVGKQVFRLENGQVYCFAPNQPHGYNCKTLPGRQLFIFMLDLEKYSQFLAQLTGQPAAGLPALAQGLPVLHISYSKKAEQLLMELHKLPPAGGPELNKFQQALRTASLINNLLSLLYVSSGFPPLAVSGGNGTIGRIIQVLNQSPIRPRSLADIALQCGISKHHLCRVFRRHTGLTVKNYLDTLRLQEARELILGQGLNIQEASRKCGFNSTTRFIQVFKKHLGQTPKQWSLASAADR